MSVTLIKCSSPGWVKKFPDVEAARIELLKYICDTCMAGDEDDQYPLMPPNPKKIHDLLGTSCGCEFELEGTD